MVNLTETERITLETVKKIVQKEIRPMAGPLDEKGEFPWHAHKVFSEVGLMATLIPEEYGGMGLRYLVFSMILEEISKVCASSALLLIAQADGTLPILYRGSEDQKKTLVPELAKGAIGAFAAPEPNAGSDILSMGTRATYSEGFYLINGQKCFITNGSVADLICLFAYTDPEKRAKGVSAFVVEKGSPGLSYGKNENKMGMKGSVNSELFFENMRIPESHRIGEEGEGFSLMMKTLDSSRLFCASQAVGIAQGAID
ncbi:MAG: acyl-CoA dehydrogenase family protein, partial [Desulfatiglandales bacterium]